MACLGIKNVRRHPSFSAPVLSTRARAPPNIHAYSRRATGNYSQRLEQVRGGVNDIVAAAAAGVAPQVGGERLVRWLVMRWGQCRRTHPHFWGCLFVCLCQGGWFAGGGGAG